MDKQAYKLELTRIISAVTFSLVGVVLSAALVIYLFSSGMTASNDIAAVVGIFTGITGTLVGAFLGVHIGSSGKEQQHAEHRKMEVMTGMAFAVMSPEQAQKALDMAKAEMSTDP